MERGMLCPRRQIDILHITPKHPAYEDKHLAYENKHLAHTDDHPGTRGTGELLELGGPGELLEPGGPSGGGAEGGWGSRNSWGPLGSINSPVPRPPGRSSVCARCLFSYARCLSSYARCFGIMCKMWHLRHNITRSMTGWAELKK